jgi:hypothetical protein
MTTLKSLAQSAMLGSTDESLLASAIRVGIAEVGGYVPVAFTGGGEKCNPESRPRMPEKASRLLKRMLEREQDDLLPEFLQEAAKRGYIAPPETLPGLLGLSRNKWRSLILPLIGERGSWLAAHNPAWAYARKREPLDVWENGTRAERILVLEQMRTSDPAQGREWVQSNWEIDSPADRAAFLATFAIGLSMEDEPFLEACLDDKRKEVREAARRLLLRLEGSHFVQRMWERVEPLIRIRSNGTLEVTLREEVDPVAKRDGIGEFALPKKMGEKASRLAQMLALTPPALWTREFDCSPNTWLAMAFTCEWKEPLLLGWQMAAIGTADADWAESLILLWMTKEEAESLLDMHALSALVSLVRAERIEAWVTSIDPTLSDIRGTRAITLLEMYQKPWTANLSRWVIKSVQQQSAVFHQRLLQALPDFARWMPPELADEFSQGWADEPGSSGNKKIRTFLQILEFRNAIKSSLEEKS